MDLLECARRVMEIEREGLERLSAGLDDRFVNAVEILRETVERNGKIERETRYYLSSAMLDAKTLARAVRAQWGIELSSKRWRTSGSTSPETAKAAASSGRVRDHS